MPQNPPSRDDPSSESPAAARLRDQAARVREAGALGRSDVIHRLFDFLVDCSLRGETPREVDIAVEVFGRTTAFDVSQDASVRVYIYRLRRKLDEFYAGPGRDETERLVIPKGEYRLEVAPRTPAADAAAPGNGPRVPGRRRIQAMVAAGIIGILVLNAGFWMALRPAPAGDGLDPVRQSAVWAPIAGTDREIIIAVGDYYIFGDTEKTMRVQRLVREFSINSREGLYQYLMSNPHLMGRYVDVGLRYLPISVAYALKDVLPVLSATPAAAQDNVRVVLTSELTPEMVRGNHVVYMGLLSGMGLLLEPVFAGSRFAVGETYDELIDETTGKRYVSQVNRANMAKGSDRDYGYFSTFAGPKGGRVVVIAGTRDIAVQQIAEEVTDADDLASLTERIPNNTAFEALYGVEGEEQVSAAPELVVAAPLDRSMIWAGASAQEFPER